MALEDRATAVWTRRPRRVSMAAMPPRTPLSPRVLIVDDQHSFREMARRVLEWRGYLVAGEADSAAAAIDAAERLSPDAVLLDVCLGKDSGFDVACAMTEACPSLAVLLVSSIDYRDCHVLLRECGACGFVLKSELACADLAAYWPARRA
jgi:two-component system chemotaxis response regulator CheY